jgi:hypothetical protein
MEGEGISFKRQIKKEITNRAGICQDFSFANSKISSSLFLYSYIPHETYAESLSREVLNAGEVQSIRSASRYSLFYQANS